MDENEEREEREEVADETTPETDEQATEQRTDDYDGLARRMDDLMDMVRDGFEGVRTALDALGVTMVEGTGAPEIDETTEAAADAVDDLLGIDALDLL